MGEKLKKYKCLLIAFKVIILIMLIMVTFSSFDKTYFLWEMNGGSNNGYLSFFKIGYQNSIFRPFLILLLPTFGLCINRPLGWILIMSYLYFVLTNLIYSVIQSGLIDEFSILLLSVGLIFTISFIVFFNMNKVYNGIYKILNSKHIRNNSLALGVGVIITLLIN